MAAVCVGLLSGAQALAVPVTEVRFEGNEKTQESVLRQELLLREGDELTPELVEASRQAIMNLGLFKKVESRVESDGAGERIVFQVDERHYLLPIPRLDGNYEEQNYSYGLDLRHDNVLGLNHRLKLVIEKVESVDSSVPVQREMRFTYRVPRLVGTPYSLYVEANKVREDIVERDPVGETVTGSYQKNVNSGGFSVSRWLDAGWISQGWTVGLGPRVVERDFQRQTGSALVYQDSRAIALVMGLNNNKVQEHRHHRSGESLSYSLSVASPRLSSDYSYTSHWFRYRHYRHLPDSGANLNTQFRLALANGSAFDEPAYSIGNSSLLRGYENGYAEGDAMMLLNLEYHHPLSGHPQVRGVVFGDLGNAWESPEKMNMRDMPLGVGMGLRWRIESFVDVTLRIDYGYAVQAETYQASINTHASF